MGALRRSMAVEAAPAADEDEVDPMSVDPTGPCCGIFDPPTRFEEREIVRIANRKQEEICEELTITLKKLGLFILWFYCCLYVCCLILALSLDVTFKANLPFGGNGLDWDDDEGVAIGVGNLIAFVLTIPAVVVVVREGASREYDQTWDFVCTLGLLHLILTCIVKLEFPTEGLWWITVLGGLLILLVLGWYSCTKYWEMKGLERLVGKVGKLNSTAPAPATA